MQGCQQGSFNLCECNLISIARMGVVGVGFRKDLDVVDSQVALICQSIKTWTRTTVGDILGYLVMVSISQVVERVVLS